MVSRLVMTAFECPKMAMACFAAFSATSDDRQSKPLYCSPHLLLQGPAVDLILGRLEPQSKRAAKRVRQLIQDSGGSLTFSATEECNKLQVDLPLVSKQFKKLYQMTIRAYSRQVR